MSKLGETEIAITNLLIALLGSARSSYRFNTILRNRAFARQKASSVRVALTRLHRKGLVLSSETGWSLSKQGQQQFAEQNRFTLIPSPFKNLPTQRLLISFDIPQSKRRVRDWLRAQLKIFSYQLIHQSLWIGPGPLPKAFHLQVQELEIKDCLKIFKVSQK